MRHVEGWHEWFFGTYFNFEKHNFCFVARLYGQRSGKPETKTPSIAVNTIHFWLDGGWLITLGYTHLDDKPHPSSCSAFGSNCPGSQRNLHLQCAHGHAKQWCCWVAASSQLRGQLYCEFSLGVRNLSLVHFKKFIFVRCFGMLDSLQLDDTYIKLQGSWKISYMKQQK